MKRHLLAVGCMASALFASIAWTQDAERRSESPNLVPAPNLGEEAAVDEADALRERLLRLVEEKAELMDREALEEALSEVQDDIGELQALRKLEEARRVLSSIVEENPETDGARRAQRMLDVDEEPQPPESTPFFPSPRNPI